MKRNSQRRGSTRIEILIDDGSPDDIAGLLDGTGWVVTGAERQVCVAQYRPSPANPTPLPFRALRMRLQQGGVNGHRYHTVTMR